MNITVKLFTPLDQYLPEGGSGKSCQIKLSRAATPKHIITRLKIPAHTPMLILINGLHSSGGQELKDGDVVSFVPPVSGGAAMAVWSGPAPG